jgi:hypothetical protein
MYSDEGEGGQDHMSQISFMFEGLRGEWVKSHQQKVGNECLHAMAVCHKSMNKQTKQRNQCGSVTSTTDSTTLTFATASPPENWASHTHAIGGRPKVHTKKEQLFSILSSSRH